MEPINIEWPTFACAVLKKKKKLVPENSIVHIIKMGQYVVESFNKELYFHSIFGYFWRLSEIEAMPKEAETFFLHVAGKRINHVINIYLTA